jgi:hypothetical protein
MAPATRAAHLSLVVLIAVIRLFHTQRKSLFTVSSNTKSWIIFFGYNATEIAIVCALQGFLQVAPHGAE